MVPAVLRPPCRGQVAEFRSPWSGNGWFRPQKLQPDFLQFTNWQLSHWQFTRDLVGSGGRGGEVEREAVSPGEWGGEESAESPGLAGGLEGLVIEGLLIEIEGVQGS